MINSPLHFEGSKKSKTANINTHHWINAEDLIVCNKCDCVYGGIYSEWPCGYPVPRMDDSK